MAGPGAADDRPAGGSPSRRGALFGFVQLEVPWLLGPADGRYVLRDGPGSDAISHVVVLATVGDARRRATAGRLSRRRARILDAGGDAAGVAAPARSVSVSRATVIRVDAPFSEPAAARAWLADAGEPELGDALRALRRLLHSWRLAAADPDAPTVDASRLLGARTGWGDGDAVAAGRWAQARELATDAGRRGPDGRGGGGTPGRTRRRGSAADGRFAALLSGRHAPLACEELVLRVQHDLDEERPREAALQLLVALDAALAELPADPGAPRLAPRIDDLRGRRAAVADAAQAALSGIPSPAACELVADTAARLAAALRARSAGAG